MKASIWTILDRIVVQLEESPAIYLIGSRVSYTFAYYLGWSLTKVRRGINISSREVTALRSTGSPMRPTTAW
jgi:DNA-binding MurR/RpiR family transcriptional regulator